MPVRSNTAPAMPPPVSRESLTAWLATPHATRDAGAIELSCADREHFDRMRNPQRRAEFILSRSLRSHAGVPSDAACSVSHSGGYAALLMGAAGTSLGVDLELHRPRDVMALARFAFAAAEIASLESLPDADRTRQFYTLWVMKEACAKALRLELIDALRLCVFGKQDDRWAGSLPTMSAWRIAVFEPRPGMSLAVTCVGDSGCDLSAASLHLSEWPDVACVQWPLVARLASSAPQGAAALHLNPLPRG